MNHVVCETVINFARAFVLLLSQIAASVIRILYGGEADSGDDGRLEGSSGDELSAMEGLGETDAKGRGSSYESSMSCVSIDGPREGAFDSELETCASSSGCVSGVSVPIREMLSGRSTPFRVSTNPFINVKYV